MTEPRLVVLRGRRLTATVLVGDGVPELVAVGHPADGPTAAYTSTAVPHGGLDARVPLGVVAEESVGHLGRPGIAGARDDGSGWSPRFSVREAEHDEHRFVCTLTDPVAELELEIRIRVDDVVVVECRLTNTGASSYTVHRLAPSIPMPHTATDLVTFHGRWVREFHTTREPWHGLRVVENRRGRSSHQSPPALIAGTEGFGEQHGQAWGAQLAWSGNHDLAAEVLADGRRHLQLGELLLPGEVVLEPGESYTTPDVIVAWSDRGVTGVSRAWHAHARSIVPAEGPRPVTMNTWEAVYFDHDLDRLCALADVGAEVGVERFVLDDGWFGGRRDDTAGLGDWWVSPDVWPDGLDPLIDHVLGLGMEFGLWVEPEMVNPDSELYRAHPDWTLTTAGYDPVVGRHQLVLDFGMPDVRDHIVDAISRLLSNHRISYLKWDMNRDIVQGSHEGRPGVHGHVLGLYEVLDRLRRRHPRVEIESCASGGGRPDLGILAHTARVWTSDCNDALERQEIQRGFTTLLPPEIMGAHIGPPRSHTTGRRQSLRFRAATALFGHLGIEWNLLDASEDERRGVAAAIALHKRLRPLLHGGDVTRGDHPDQAALVHGVVAGGREHAVFAYVQMATARASVPAPLRLDGLDPDSRYRVSVITDLGEPRLAARGRPDWIETTIEASGAFLAGHGLPMPVLDPESCLLVECHRTG